MRRLSKTAERRRSIPPAVRALLIAAAALLAATAAGAEGITAVVDRTAVAVDERLLLSVTVEGARSERPELPPLPDFEVRPAGQQTQMQWVDGRSSSSVTYNYVLYPKGIGSFEIGPATVELDGRTYASEPFTVQVLESTSPSADRRDLFVTARVSTTTPWVGQQVVYIWRFYRRVRVGDARLEGADFEGLLVEDLGDVREYQAAVEGRQYLVSEIRKALFPQEAGPVTIRPSRLSVEVLAQNDGRRSPFEDFFSRPETATRVLRSEPIELEVRSLPPAPPGFQGLVGEFELRSAISKRELTVGESTTLELKVSGSGNTQMISEPPLPPLAGFKIYDDKPSGALERDGNRLTGSKTFSKALVPLESGDLVIPALELPYFDPGAGEYRTARTEPIALSVRPAAGEEELRLTESMAPTAGKVAVRIVADDILPLYTGIDAVERRPFPPRGAWLAASLALPAALYLGLALAVGRRRRLELDVGLRRRRTALRSARGRLRELRGMQENGRAAAETASRCLREFVGDKLGVEGSALTAGDVDRGLRRTEVDDELVAEATGLLERFEAAQYGAGAVTPAEAADQLEPLLRRLDREIGR